MMRCDLLHLSPATSGSRLSLNAREKERGFLVRREANGANEGNERSRREGKRVRDEGISDYADQHSRETDGDREVDARCGGETRSRVPVCGCVCVSGRRGANAAAGFMGRSERRRSKERGCEGKGFCCCCCRSCVCECVPLVSVSSNVVSSSASAADDDRVTRRV